MPIQTQRLNIPRRAGVPNPGVSTGAMNTAKTHMARRIAKQALVGTTGLGGSRQAGMMMTNLPLSSGTYFNSQSLATYYTSYANGMAWGGGTRDIPPYFVQMNEQNGGILYWPVTLREKYEFYRYFARTDSYCGRALDLLCDLPMSKFVLRMPKMEGKSKELKDEIHGFFKGMVEELGLFQKIRSMIREREVIGNVYMYHEWNPERKTWDKLFQLPPEEVAIFHYPCSEDARVEYRPERLMGIIREMDDMNATPLGQQDNPIYKEIVSRIPEEMREMVKKEGCIIMDTDPASGSFVCHLARDKADYHDLGASVLERVFVPMLMKEHFRYTQLGLASRNMTPKNKISAPNLTPDELADLRAQVDLSYLDPEFSIVTNYDWDWQQIGAEGRLLDLAAEHEALENQIFAGLGVTRELLTGEGVYSGTKITVEILNNMFMLTREIIQDYVEKKLFKPVAEAHGWYETDKHGYKTYYYPRVGFNRLSIRDNAEVFDSLFQLYQKGSLPVDIIYELFNLDTDEIHDKIYADMFTVKDPTFNRVLEEANAEVGRALVASSDLKYRVGRYLRLHQVDDQGNPLPASKIPSNIMTPMEQFEIARAEAREREILHPEIEALKEFTQEDVNDVAEQIAENIDTTLSPEELLESITQSVDEVIK